MKKRLTMALAAGALVGVMLPGVASAGQPNAEIVATCVGLHGVTLEFGPYFGPVSQMSDLMQELNAGRGEEGGCLPGSVSISIFFLNKDV